jgi:hypothetical protein
MFRRMLRGLASVADALTAASILLLEQQGNLSLIVKDGKLLLDVNRDDFHELQQFAPNHFHVADEPWGNEIDLHFVPADAQQPRHIDESFDADKPRSFQLVDPAPAAADALAEYVGDYTSEEIDPVYRLLVKDGTLYLTRLKAGADALRPAIKDVFVADLGKIRFTRDAAGQVSGFILDAGRIENLKFTKKLKS